MLLWETIPFLAAFPHAEHHGACDSIKDHSRTLGNRTLFDHLSYGGKIRRITIPASSGMIRKVS
jgi:hypothetical protein